MVTARSSKKGQAIVDSLDERLRSDVAFAVIEDVGLDGAFDQVFRSPANVCHILGYVMLTWGTGVSV